jgi:amino acid adenylation domain-containing protein
MTAGPPLPTLRLAPSILPSEVVPSVNPADFDTVRPAIDHVRDRAARDPQQIAVIDGDVSLSYTRFVDLVDATADALRAHAGPGDVVACLGPRSRFTAALFLALESIGALYLPLDPAWPPSRIDEVLAISGYTALVDYTDPQRDEPTVTPGDRPIRHADDQARYIIYTSGTTGRPKGAVVAAPGMRNHLWAKVADLDLTARDRVAFTAPLAFDISIWQMITPLIIGATVVVANDEQVLFPKRLYRLITGHRVTVVELVPTAIGTLLDSAERQAERPLLPELRWLISTGEELRPTLAERALNLLPAARLLNAYGPTECSDDVTHHVVTRDDVRLTRLPVGRPIGNAKIYCLRHSDEDDCWWPVEPGQPGELFVGGVPVGLGYLNDTTATGRAFFRDPIDPASPTGRLYRTGDLGRIEGDVIHYLGRIDRQVKVAGVRMELDEIEARLSAHPAVRQCAVVLVEEDDRPRLVAHCVLGAPVETDELEEFLQSWLPANLVPRRWRLHDDLPTTPHGKIDHRALR